MKNLIWLGISFRAQILFWNLSGFDEVVNLLCILGGTFDFMHERSSQCYIKGLFDASPHDAIILYMIKFCGVSSFKQAKIHSVCDTGGGNGYKRGKLMGESFGMTIVGRSLKIRTPFPLSVVQVTALLCRTHSTRIHSSVRNNNCDYSNLIWYCSFRPYDVKTCSTSPPSTCSSVSFKFLGLLKF